MRFRKSIGITKGIKLNLSKSGFSLTGKLAQGLSLNAGAKGVFLNAGIAGTGLYDRVKVASGGELTMDNIETARDNGVGSEIQNIPYKKTFGYFVSFLIWAVIIVCIIADILVFGMCLEGDPPHLNKDRFLKSVIIPFFLGGGLFALWLQNKIKYNKNKKLYNAKLQDTAEYIQKLINIKIEKTRALEGFEDAKIFVLNYDNIIAFSKSGTVLFWCPQFKDNGTAKGVSIDAKDLKITQEINAGDCYAHFLTTDFAVNKIDVFLGNAHGKQELDAVRATYNEIKELLAITKKA